MTEIGIYNLLDDNFWGISIDADALLCGFGPHCTTYIIPRHVPTPERTYVNMMRCHQCGYAIYTMDRPSDLGDEFDGFLSRFHPRVLYLIVRIDDPVVFDKLAAMLFGKGLMYIIIYTERQPTPAFRQAVAEDTCLRACFIR